MRDNEDTTEIPDGLEASEQALDLELQRCDELLAGAEPLVPGKHDDALLSAVGRFLRGRDPHHSADEPTFKDAEHRLKAAIISSRLHPWTSPQRVDDNLFDFLALVHELRWDDSRTPTTEVGLFMRLHLVLRIIEQTRGRSTYERVVQMLGRVQETRGFASCLKHLVETCADEHSAMARLAIDRTTTDPVGSYDTRKKLVSRRWARLCVLTLWAKVFAKSHGDASAEIASSKIEWPAGMATTAIKGTAAYRESLKIQNLARLSLEEAGKEIEASCLESDSHDAEAIAIFAKTMSDVYSEVRLDYESVSSFIRQTLRYVLPSATLASLGESAHADWGRESLEVAGTKGARPRASSWWVLSPLAVVAVPLIVSVVRCNREDVGRERADAVQSATNIRDIGITRGLGSPTVGDASTTNEQAYHTDDGRHDTPEQPTEHATSPLRFGDRPYYPLSEMYLGLGSSTFAIDSTGLWFQHMHPVSSAAQPQRIPLLASSGSVVDFGNDYYAHLYIPRDGLVVEKRGILYRLYETGSVDMRALLSNVGYMRGDDDACRAFSDGADEFHASDISQARELQEACKRDARAPFCDRRIESLEYTETDSRGIVRSSVRDLSVGDVIAIFIISPNPQQGDSLRPTSCDGGECVFAIPEGREVISVVGTVDDSYLVLARPTPAHRRLLDGALRYMATLCRDGDMPWRSAR